MNNSQPYNAPTSVPQTLTVRPSKTDPNFMVIHRGDVVDNFVPLYSLSISTKSKPNVVLYRGPHSPSTIIGTAVFHSLSGKIDLVLHGEPLTIKPSGMPIAHHFEFPPVGKLKWQANQTTGLGLELRDASGMKVVKLKSSGFLSEEKVFEMMVPCDPRFLDLVVLSGWAIRADMNRANSIVADIFGAVLGG